MTDVLPQGEWSGRPVLVTGAGGFIGSHLTERLVREGARVRAFVRYTSRGGAGWIDTFEPEVLSEVEVFRGDLVNPEAVDGAMDGCEVVFHLGALIPIPYSYRHPREFVETNVVGTTNVLEAARRRTIERLVHTSTSEVYGTARSDSIDEQHSLRAQSPYAATKVAADQLALSYQRSFGTPVVITRPFNTFGPRQSARAVIATIISQALERSEIELGATDTTRDFVYVADTVDGFLRCGSTSGLEGEVLNLGTGVEVTIGHVVELVLRIIGRDVDVVTDVTRLRPPASEVERLIADASKAQRLTGWQPNVPLYKALEETVEWFRSNLGGYDSSSYHV